MAFEGDIQTYAPTEVDEVGQIILKARELLSDPAKWCQGRAANDRGARCIIGALWELDDEAAQLRALRRIRKLAGTSIVLFNDDPNTTHAMVLDLLDRAATNSTAQGD